MDLNPNPCCWGCSVALSPIAVCILLSLIALGTGRALGTKAGLLVRGLGFGLSVAGLLAGLAALYAIVRFGIAWEAGWGFSPPDFTRLASTTEEASLHQLYDRVFAVAGLVAMIVTWIAVPRIGRGVVTKAPSLF